jgi:hypothetical protein
MAEDYSDIFAERRKRISEEKEQIEKSLADREASRKSALLTLQSKIRPVVQRAAEQIKANGFGATVDGPADSTAVYPTITLKIEKKPTGKAMPATLTFKADASTVRADPVVYNGPREAINYSQSPLFGSAKLDTVDEAWIEKMIRAFLSDALQHM